MRSKVTQNTGVFGYLLLLTGFFLLLEISFFIQSNHAYLYDFQYVTRKLPLPWSILPGILYFIGAQLVLHLAYCVFVWSVARLTTDLLRIKRKDQLTFAIILWLLGLITIFLANQCAFPNSKFAHLSAQIIPNLTVASLLLAGLLLAWCLLIGLALLVLLIKINRKSRFYLFLFSSVVLGLGLFLWRAEPLPTNNIATVTRPNIFIVGVDSLRPDFLHYFHHRINTPFFDGFLKQATYFSGAVTPLARTFPSWVSILTGQYPRQNGVRFNLADQSRLKFSHTLPAILRQQGYRTILATDETRFSNIDKNFGFEQLITPPVGVNDFLVGTFNDFPLSNLVINTPLGRWLFPYSYANRATYITYNPNSFLRLLSPELKKPQIQPLFLAIHFCLPHYPYLFADLDGDLYTVKQRYEASIHRVDQQLADFFTMLTKYHLLDHAMVVLLSDHGEALELAGDRITQPELFVPKKRKPPRFYPPSLDHEAMNQSAGHGTDVLGLPQYHTLLAFRWFGLEHAAKPGAIKQHVSLIDIKPTILDLLHIDQGKDGQVSWLPLLLGKPALSLRQHIFLESDYSPQAIRTVYPETRQVLLEGVALFRIDADTTRLVMKEDLGHKIIHSKQVADIYGEWMLAFYPQNQHWRMPILINLKTGLWTNDLHSAFAKAAPTRQMVTALKAFYGDELFTVPRL